MKINKKYTSFLMLLAFKGRTFLEYVAIYNSLTIKNSKKRPEFVFRKDFCFHAIKHCAEVKDSLRPRKFDKKPHDDFCFNANNNLRLRYVPSPSPFAPASSSQMDCSEAWQTPSHSPNTPISIGIPLPLWTLKNI